MLGLSFFLFTFSFQPLPDGLELDFRIDATPENGFSFPGGIYYHPVGAPNLPGQFFYIGVPQEGGVRVEIVEEESRTYPGEIKPVGKFSFEETSFEKDPEIYSRAEYYPDLFFLEGPFRWRDLRVVRLQVNPIRYNPGKRLVSVTSHLRLRLVFEGRPRVVRRSSTFDNIYPAVILNYEQAKDWRILDNPLKIHPIFDMPLWFKMVVDSDGLYQIDYELLKRFIPDPGQIDPRTIRVYTAKFDTLGGNKIDTTLFDGLIEIPILVYGEEDGRFDRGDYILFYGFGASHLSITKPETLTYFNNPFDRSNFFWLTFGAKPGKRFSRIDGRIQPGEICYLLRHPVHLEEEKENPGRSGLNWAWQTMTITGSGSWAFPITHYGATGEGDIKVKIITFGHKFEIKLYYNDSLFFDTLWLFGNVNLRKKLNYIGDSGILRIDLFSSGSDSFSVFLDNLELNYRSRPILQRPLYSLVTVPGSYQYAIGGVHAPPLVLDITDLRNPRLFYNLQVEGESLYFSHRVDSLALLYITDLKKVRRPILTAGRVGNLRRETAGCDYLILTADEFYEEMKPLLMWRQREYQVRMVRLSEVYNNFGFGKEEPAAIKYFLYYVYRNWQPMPKFVLFVGDGSYDYKNNLKLEKPNRFFPPLEQGMNLQSPDGNYCYDDWFVMFNSTKLPEMIVGRLNVRNKQMARIVVKKILDYEQKVNLGPWAKNIIFLGDDEWSPYGLEWDSIRSYWEHSANCESLLFYIPDSLVDITKIYMNVYPNESGKKPKARLDFIAAMNKGAFCGAYYGHGNNHQLAHEGGFYGEDVNLVKNGPRNFFFYYGTCSPGRFDDTKYESICEEFVCRADGAIGTYGATRVTSPGQNVPLGNLIFDNIFNKNFTMGECCYHAKLMSPADITCCLFGDPGVRLNRPIGGVSISVQPDTLRPLSQGRIRCGEPKYFLRATIRDSLTGLTHYIVRDQQGRFVDSFNFSLEGQTFFSGVSSQESIGFIVPQFATRHQPVLRFSIYNNLRSGRLDSVPLRGLAVPSGDIEPPRVEFYAQGRRLKDGDWVEKNLSLTGVIEDASGINLIDPAQNERQGFGLYVNGNKAGVIDLRNYFSYDLDSYQRGRFTVELNLPDRTDTITVYVSDNNYNRTEAKLGLRVAQDEELVVEDFLVYPNPLDEGGYFTFVLSVDARVRLEIYTVSGRFVRRLDHLPMRAGFNKVWWDGLDQRGDRPANGVYLVKIEAIRERGGNRRSISRIEKFIIHHRP
ncbi:MAG: C25 family cysteine peptidase [candidate division WOR-3 bacterium]